MNAQFIVSLGLACGVFTAGALAHGPAVALVMFLITVAAGALITRGVLR